MEKYLRPAFLKKGDTVAILAMASTPNPDSFKCQYWRDVLTSWGLKIKYGKHVNDSLPGDFAGTPEERAADIEEALKDPEVKALISFRGGYGSMHTLAALDKSLFVKYPKWIVGFSDITIFHACLSSRRIESLLGAMPCNNPDGKAKDADISEKGLHDALFGKLKSYESGKHKYSRKGKAVGRLYGGNLALMISTLGTPYENHFDEDTILFIEDIDERMYTVDRMLMTLKEGGYLKRIKGLIIGQFTDIGGQDEWKRKVLDLINDYTKDLDKPVLFGFPCGHEHPNFSLYEGREVSLTVDAKGGKLEFL